MISLGRRNQFQMKWTIKFLPRISPSLLVLLTSLHIEILGRRLPPPPGNAMMHFTDKIGKLFSSHSVFYTLSYSGRFWDTFSWILFQVISTFGVFLDETSLESSLKTCPLPRTPSLSVVFRFSPAFSAKMGFFY